MTQMLRTLHSCGKPKTVFWPDPEESAPALPANCSSHLGSEPMIERHQAFAIYLSNEIFKSIFLNTKLINENESRITIGICGMYLKQCLERYRCF